jgi:glycosyltransferase involved in cell wall biosynthesis
MNNNKLVSIVIPTFNSEKTILNCINSVFNQTYQNFEIIICDDNSTDNTREIFKKITDNRVRIYYLDKNCGSAVARNVAMQNAKGSFFAFLDSDDEWHANKLENQIPCFSDINVGLVLSGATIIKNENKRVIYIPKKDWEITSHKKLFLGEIKYLTPTIVIRRECVEKIGYMIPELRRNQDYDFFLRILKYFKLKILETNLATINQNTKKVTFEMLEDSIRFYEKERITLFKEDFTQKEINLFFARKYRDLACAMLRAKKYGRSIKPIQDSLNYSITFLIRPNNLVMILKSIAAGLLTN